MVMTLLERFCRSLGLSAPDAHLFNRSIFWVKPYLQLGSNPDTLLLSWFSLFSKRHWRIQMRKTDQNNWTNLKIQGVGNYHDGASSIRHLNCELPQLVCGQTAEYRLLLNDSQVFESSYAAPSSNGKTRVVVSGDFGDGERKAAKIAAQIFEASPDLLVMPGDLVYEYGRVSEYREFFFPVLNADVVHENVGAPLLRSIPFVAVAGNHDIGMPKQSDKLDLAEFSDPFGYFLFWHGSGNSPKLKRATLERMFGERKKAGRLLEKFGKKFLNATNYSFNFQNQHWVVIDANKYMDWRQPELRHWLLDDLLSHADADWRFVTFHQPGFNSDLKYRKDERMRLLGDIFEQGRVDVVYNGHCHFYERHFPITFRPDLSQLDISAGVPGEMLIDSSFDGINKKTPKGVIYLVTGAGGKLVDENSRPSLNGLSATTCKIFDECCSFTLVETEPNRALIRQISEDGVELDRFEIAK